MNKKLKLSLLATLAIAISLFSIFFFAKHDESKPPVSETPSEVATTTEATSTTPVIDELIEKLEEVKEEQEAVEEQIAQSDHVEDTTVTTTTSVEVEREKPGEVSGKKITEENILNGVNKIRYEEGLNILKRNAVLDAAADAKANDIIKQDYWSHTNPQGKKFSAFIIEAGYNYKYAGENLAKEFDTVQGTINAWVASPTHYANIVQGNYTETGIAVRGDLVVQVFGSK